MPLPGTKNPEIGPGSYDKSQQKAEEDEKRQNFKQMQEIMAFHKLRKIFPDKNSISTVQLNRIKAQGNENLGPGTYAQSMEKDSTAKKSFGAPLAAPFGTTEDRQLDTRAPGLKSNPGPGDYSIKARP